MNPRPGLLGRCGISYQCVPTEFTAWHATWWNPNSIGIEIDCIGPLFKSGNNLVSEYGTPRKDVYCSLDDKDVYFEKNFNGVKYWACESGSIPELAVIVSSARATTSAGPRSQPKRSLPRP